MATLDDLDELALGLPQTERHDSDDGRPEWVVGNGKSFVRHREPRGDAIDPATGERMEDVLMFRTADLESREVLLERPCGAFFVTDHFAGYPAVLMRIPDLAKVSREELDDVVVEAWLAVAPKRVAKAWLAEQEGAGD